MRVNSPGPALGAGAGAGTGGGALGAGASGEFMARNICVKLPGSPLPEGGGAGGTKGVGSARLSGITAEKAEGVWPEAEIFSMGTGLNTLASSSEGRTAGGALGGSGSFSACNMRVNSPGPDLAGAAGGGGPADAAAAKGAGGGGGTGG